MAQTGQVFQLRRSAAAALPRRPGCRNQGGVARESSQPTISRNQRNRAAIAMPTADIRARALGRDPPVSGIDLKKARSVVIERVE